MYVIVRNVASQIHSIISFWLKAAARFPIRTKPSAAKSPLQQNEETLFTATKPAATLSSNGKPPPNFEASFRPVGNSLIVRLYEANHLFCMQARRRHGGTWMPALLIDFLVALHISLTTCFSSSGFPTNTGGRSSSNAAQAPLGRAIVNSSAINTSTMQRAPPELTSTYSQSPVGQRPIFSHLDLQSPRIIGKYN